MDRAAGCVLARDLLSRAVLPRLFRTLLNVQDVIKDMPDEAAIGKDVDVDAIRRMVRTALPG
jgi:hypothetical protein